MLDHTQEPPARLVAQMRAFTKENGLPDDLADMLAQVPGMTAKKAAAIKPGLNHIAKYGGSHTEEATMAFLSAGSDGKQDEREIVTRAAAILDELSVRDMPKIKQPTMAALGYEESPRGGFTFVGAGGRASIQERAVTGLMKCLDPKGGHRSDESLTPGAIAMMVCRENGLRPFNEADAVRMASHSTSDFPLILENSMTNLVARRLEQRMPDLIRASREVPRFDYRSGNSVTLSATSMMKEVNEGGEVNFVTADEKGEALPALRDFASGFNITNKALVNDATALGLLNDIGSKMVQGAVERLRAVLLEPLEANSGAGQTMADGTAMFHSDHGNLASSGATISVTTLSDARTAMRKQKGLNGEILAIEPWALVVPAELETVAQQVLATINATSVSDANPFQNSLELIVEPALSDAAAWYLIGDPTRYDGLAHAFLDGQSSPRVETRPGWHTLGTEMRLVWALDAKFIETATWYRNPGA